MNKQEIELANRIRTQEFAARVNELTALEKEFGPGVIDTVRSSRAEMVRKEWQSIASQVSSNDIEGLMDTLWAWCAGAGFEFTRRDEDGCVTMNVTHCPLASMAESLDARKWGYTCYCCDDYSITEGFNPDIIFTRTKTLMEGHDCCNHSYRMREGKTT